MSKAFITGSEPTIGKGKVANLPQEVIQGEYPKCVNYRGPVYDDTIVDIDDIASRTEGRARKHVSYQK